MKQIILSAFYLGLVTACAPLSPYDSCVRSETRELKELERHRDALRQIELRGYKTKMIWVDETVMAPCTRAGVETTCPTKQPVRKAARVPINRAEVMLDRMQIDRAIRVEKSRLQISLKQCDGLSKEVPVK